MGAERQRILRCAAFALLRRRRNRLCIILTVAICAIYYGFILAMAFAPGLMAYRVTSAVTLAIPLCLAVIISAVALTGIYVWRANKEFDGLVDSALRGS